MDDKKIELDDDHLEQVSGGTQTDNMDDSTKTDKTENVVLLKPLNIIR